MKILIGWKAKNRKGKWFFFLDKPIKRRWFFETKVDGYGKKLPDHPEQPEINWKDSLKPIYDEV